ncbi:MAG TPA: RNA polymerase sigma factor [Verrucomicrobiae bacterium]
MTNLWIAPPPPRADGTDGRNRLEQIEALSPEVHRFVERRVDNREDAEDIAQQALLVACAKFETFRGENLRGWLLTIARNLMTDYYRRQQRFEFVDMEDATQLEMNLAVQTDPGAVQEACANRERLRCYFDCIAKRLPLEAQVAVLLADVLGNRDKDAADQLGVSVPSFKLLIHQARARLHEAAGGWCALVDRGNGGKDKKPLRVNTHESGAATGKNGESAGRCHPICYPETVEVSRFKPLGHNPDWNIVLNFPNHAPRFDHGLPVNGESRSPDHGGIGQPHCDACGAGGLSCPPATQCAVGLKCRLGLKCGQIVPRLLALRDTLLAKFVRAVGSP